MRWTRPAAAGILTSALLACGCGPEDHRSARVAQQRRPIRVGTFFFDGPTDPTGRAVKEQFERYYPELQVERLTTADTATNMMALHRDEADLVFTFAPLAYLAFNGQLRRLPEQLDRLRGVATLETVPLQILVRPGLAAEEIPQLTGKRVGIGPSGSECLFPAELLLSAYGLTFQDFQSETLIFEAASDRLLRGDLDASFVCGGYPVPAVATATAGGARLLQITGPAVEKLHAHYPFLKLMSIPAGTYPRIGAVRTIGPDGLLATRSTLGEEEVYKLTRAFFLTLPRLLLRVDMRRAPATSVPLHPGAARYYREQEMRR